LQARVATPAPLLLVFEFGDVQDGTTGEILGKTTRIKV